MIDLKKRTGRPPISEELKDLVVELYKTDMKCEDIARKGGDSIADLDCLLF